MSGADEARTLSDTLFRRLRGLEQGTREHTYVRNTLVELHLGLARYAAGRFRSRGEPLEDIVQVAAVGLIKAVNRYDVERGVLFATYAMPAITGEIKHFLRDTSWAVRVPRRLQELRLDIAKTADALEQRLGRRPTDRELTRELGVTEAELAEGRRAASGYTARPLDEPAGRGDEPAPPAREPGVDEEAYDRIECLEALKPLLAGLRHRDRLLLSMRYGDELTQDAIGERMGISQMQVSRLLSRTMTTLRAGLLADDPAPSRPARTVAEP